MEIGKDNSTLKPGEHNLRPMRAYTIELPVQKAESPVGESKQTPEDVFATLLSEKRILEAPLDPFVLSTLPEYNTELTPCLDAMETNIDGFGHRLLPRIIPEKATDQEKAEIRAERVRLENFFMYAGMKTSFRDLRRKRRRDLESTGNAYWEVVKNPLTGAIQYFVHMKAYQVRLTAQEAAPVEVEVPILELQADGRSIKIAKIKVHARFRRYVQVSTTIGTGTSVTTGYRRIWFKEFGDPRTLDKDTGEVVPEGEVRDWKKTGKPMPDSQKANEVVHWAINDNRSPYGLPRYVGVLIDVLGDRKASEINYTTFCNNNVPNLLILVSNGQLTTESVQRVRDMFTKLQGNDNRAVALVIEAESLGEDGEDAGNVKLDAKPLADQQISDAQFLKYSNDNRQKVRVSFRLPPILIGRTEDYTRTTAETSRRLADEQIFAPERDSFDDWVNRILFPQMNVVHHLYKSNSPNTTDNAELVKILAGAEKTGGMTPRIARMVLEDILGRELPPFPDDFRPDLPFSLAMAEAVKNQADVTEPGQQLTALKRLSLLTELVGEETGGGVIVETLLALRKSLEDEWSSELFTEAPEEE
jgi:PBSX family phage portal protein